MFPISPRLISVKLQCVFAGGMPSRANLPRHMIALVYTSSMLHPSTGSDIRMTGVADALVFSESCRSVFDDAPTNALVNRNVQFVPGLVDHQGSSEAVSRQPSHGVVSGRPSGGVMGARPFWLPMDKVPTSGSGVRPNLPEWVVRVAEGHSIRGGADINVLALQQLDAKL